MESVQNLKKRIKSVGNINKITKAMELVAATKMRRAQEVALSSRPYAFVALDLLASLALLPARAAAGGEKKQLPELLLQRKVKKVLFVLVASDKGLAGSFNGSVFKKFEQHVERDKEKYAKEEKFFIAVGEKASAYLLKRGANVVQKFIQIGDHTTPEQIQPLTQFITEGYLEKKWDRVVVISMHFVSALRQEPHVRRILPIDYDHIRETIEELVPKTGKFSEILSKTPEARSQNLKADYLIEPSPKFVLEDLSKHLLFIQMYHLILEANAAEHSARRLAMKTASDNASDLSETLNLEYNKSRQAGITNQIIEITAGAESLN